jgi:hypothetical protein
VPISPETLLELPLYIGQVGCTFRFDVTDGVTGVPRGTLHPLRDQAPSLEHDTTSTISRKISNLRLSVEDTAWFEPLSDRVSLVMVLGDEEETEFPLGRYLVGDRTEATTSQGDESTLTLLDEMFIVDQELEEGFSAYGAADFAIRKLLEYVPIQDLLIEANSGEGVNQAWGAGTGRGQAVQDLATAGGYFKPWFDHWNRMRFVTVFEPGDKQPTINLDTPPRVIRDSAGRSDDLATAPNRWIVRSNSTGILLGDEGAETNEFAQVVGRYDVPSSAPYSISQRGFAIPKTVEAQVRTGTAAATYARTLGIQRTLYETATVTTPPDPRHDSYDVILWRGEKWLEIGWRMPLVSGGDMTHTLRRAYPSTGEEVL